jgi:NADPH:quinone reductase-like Zn-dependent oxidoreductase
METTMRAAVMTRYGGPEVLRVVEVPRPIAGPGEVLIRIHASVATPPDSAFRSANPPIVRAFTGWLGPKYPTPGTVIAGVVEAVGQGATRFAPGARVHGFSDRTFGAYAEYICLSETDGIVPMPAGLDFAGAAAASEPFMTAMPFLRDEAKLRAGQRLLINGASGAIGSMAIQLARRMGAEVTGVCSTTNAGMVRALGAHRVIDYTREDFARTAGGWDVIFDAVGKSSFRHCRKALAPDGIYMTTVPSFHILWTMLTTKRGRGRFGLLATTGLRPAAAKLADLELLNCMLAEGAVQPVIDRRYRLDEIAAAHAYVDTGRKRGSVVIDTAPLCLPPPLATAPLPVREACIAEQIPQS